MESTPSVASPETPSPRSRSMSRGSSVASNSSYLSSIASGAGLKSAFGDELLELSILLDDNTTSTARIRSAPLSLFHNVATLEDDEERLASFSTNAKGVATEWASVAPLLLLAIGKLAKLEYKELKDAKKAAPIGGFAFAAGTEEKETTGTPATVPVAEEKKEEKEEEGGEVVVQGIGGTPAPDGSLKFVPLAPIRARGQQSEPVRASWAPFVNYLQAKADSAGINSPKRRKYNQLIADVNTLGTPNFAESQSQGIDKVTKGVLDDVRKLSRATKVRLNRFLQKVSAEAHSPVALAGGVALVMALNVLKTNYDMLDSDGHSHMRASWRRMKSMPGAYVLRFRGPGSDKVPMRWALRPDPRGKRWVLTTMHPDEDGKFEEDLVREEQVIGDDMKTVAKQEQDAERKDAERKEQIRSEIGDQVDEGELRILSEQPREIGAGTTKIAEVMVPRSVDFATPLHWRKGEEYSDSSGNMRVQVERLSRFTLPLLDMDIKVPLFGASEEYQLVFEGDGSVPRDVFAFASYIMRSSNLVNLDFLLVVALLSGLTPIIKFFFQMFVGLKNIAPKGWFAKREYILFYLTQAQNEVRERFSDLRNKFRRNKSAENPSVEYREL